MSGIVIITINHDTTADAFSAWMRDAFPHLPPEHIDMIRHDGFGCYMDEMQKIVSHMTGTWEANIGTVFNLSFDMRPVFDAEKEDERNRGVHKVFISSRRRKQQEDMRNDPILRSLLDALGDDVRVMRLDGEDGARSVHDLMETLFGKAHPNN